MRSVYLGLAAASLAAPATLAAQEAPSAPPPTTEAPQEALPASGDVSDEEVSRFAMAALIVQQISADETVPQEQQQATMEQAVQQVGVEPQRFNVLARATQNDPELAERVNLAANAHVEAARASQSSQ